MVGEAEDGRAGLGLVAADAFEDPGAVVEAVRADVDLGVGPVDELAVHPDLFGLLHRPNPRLRVVRDGVDGARARQADEIGGRDGKDVLVRPGSRSTRLRAGAARCRRGSSGSPAGGTARRHPARSPSLRALRPGRRFSPSRRGLRPRSSGRSARRSPPIITSTGFPSQMKTSDFTICARSQPTALAASSAVSVPAGNSSTRDSTAALRMNSATRSTGSGQAVMPCSSR